MLTCTNKVGSVLHKRVSTCRQHILSTTADKFSDVYDYVAYKFGTEMKNSNFKSIIWSIDGLLREGLFQNSPYWGLSIQDSRFKIVYCYTSVSRHIHTKHIVTSWKLFRSCNHSKKKHIMTSWHRNQCCKTHWANNTGQDSGQLIQFGHCPGQHCRPIRTTLILNTRKVSLDNLILSAFLKERDNMASFSNSDSCAPRLISLKTDCGILWVQGLVEAIESPWFLWRMFKKSNFALVAPDESRILMNYNFSLKEQTSVISLYYIQHPEGSATSKLINPWVTIYKW